MTQQQAARIQLEACRHVLLLLRDGDSKKCESVVRLLKKGDNLAEAVVSIRQRLEREQGREEWVGDGSGRACVKGREGRY